MSSISSTPRRPSTAQSGLLNTRMPYEAGEALLWERQNNRVHAHLSVQMKELRAQHDAYDARIQATESVAEAAEAAVHKVKQMEAKMAAMEADDRDRPFDAWAKEAISQFQIFVDGHKGVRQKLSGLEQKLGSLSEDAEDLRDAGVLLKNVVRRLEVLEHEKEEEGKKLKTMEQEVERLRSTGQRQDSGGEPDDNPFHVFYDIDTQPLERQDHTVRDDQRHREDSRSGRLTRSPEQRPRHRGNETLPARGNLQPPEDTLRPEEQSINLPEAAPEAEYGWENTQQFKDMQAELAALRAMCRTQDPKSSGLSVDTTQRLQDTIVLPRENIPEFSDATTETEADCHDADRHLVLMGAPSSDIQLPSSPPKRYDNQSARRNLMRRPSICNPRVASNNELGQLEQPAPDPRTGSRSGVPARPSLMVEMPVDTQVFDDRVPAKRKRAEDAPAQRVTRPKLTDDRAAASNAMLPTKNDGSALAEPAPLPFSEDAVAPLSPTRKTYGKQKSAVNAAPQVAPQTSPKKSKQSVVPIANPTASVTEAKKPRKTIAKPKLAAAQQQSHPDAGPSRSKQAATVKRENKPARQRPGACKSCRVRHQKCDRTYPTCQRCAKTGVSCEYPQAPGAAPPNVPSTSSPQKKQALPIPDVAEGAELEHDLRGRSVTASPESPRHKSPAKRQVPASTSKKPATSAVPTAASTRAPRTKKGPTSKASAQKQK